MHPLQTKEYVGTTLPVGPFNIPSAAPAAASQGNLQNGFDYILKGLMAESKLSRDDLSRKTVKPSSTQAQDKLPLPKDNDRNDREKQAVRKNDGVQEKSQDMQRSKDVDKLNANDEEIPDEKEKATGETDLQTQWMEIMAMMTQLLPQELQQRMTEKNLSLEAISKQTGFEKVATWLENLKAMQVMQPEELKNVTQEMKSQLQALLESIREPDFLVQASKGGPMLEDLRDPGEFLKFLDQKASDLREQMTEATKNALTNTENEGLRAKHSEKTIADATAADAPQFKNLTNQANLATLPLLEKFNDPGKLNMQMMQENLQESTEQVSKVTEAKGIGVATQQENFSAKTNPLLQGNKAEKSQQLFREALVSQIADKVRLTLSNGKQEMSMELTPENLGKLSLKIAAENGSVMAKIVADSEQVKAILESNLNLLKESLEHQGIKVQGFSIALGDRKENSQQASTQQERQRENGRETSTRIASAGQGYGKSVMTASERVLAYYTTKDSSINLTA